MPASSLRLDQRSPSLMSPALVENERSLVALSQDFSRTRQRNLVSTENPYCRFKTQWWSIRETHRRSNIISATAGGAKQPTASLQTHWNESIKLHEIKKKKNQCWLKQANLKHHLNNNVIKTVQRLSPRLTWVINTLWSPSCFCYSSLLF